MTGRELYAVFKELTLEIEFCTIEDYDELSEEGQEVWDRLSERVIQEQ